jgi:hypothetical protein
MRCCPKDIGACARCVLIPPRTGSACHPSLPQAGTRGNFLTPAGAVWLLGICLASNGHCLACELDSRTPGCGAGADARDSGKRTRSTGCVGKARRVRFKSRGRGLSSIENKRNDTGLRFVLQTPEDGNQGFLLWKGDALQTLIDWNDPVVKHGLAHRIKYARLIKRRASSQRAAGADSKGNRYSVQLALEGVPYHKPKHPVGSDTIGLDLGPSSIAAVPREGEASLAVFCEELKPDAKAIRRLQRKMDR